MTVLLVLWVAASIAAGVAAGVATRRRHARRWRRELDQTAEWCRTCRALTSVYEREG
jgi:hypothetical protein